MKNLNRQWELSMHRHLNIICGVSLAVLLSGVALAQTAPPSGIVLPQGQPVQSAPAPAPIVSGAEMPIQPPGAFESSAPVVEGDDPANQMNLNGSQDYLDTLKDSSDTRLEDLTGASVSPGTASQLEQMQAARLNIMKLNLQNEEAELAISLWGTLYNNEHAQAWREREDAREAVRLEAAAVERATLAAAEAANPQPVADQGPSVVWPVVYEVSNGVATLVTESGLVNARPGTVLTNGIRVTSVSGTGVKVSLDGREFDIGFQDSLPAPQSVQSFEEAPQENTITPLFSQPGM